ncbi:hypothetical protein ACFCX4_30055 [Kitasatospora sp. NPDC056327]|uniref:hypothetical protein n=1 Tax=Kitasatospora sp. NPDC056327 TaxID=3345785 RepID=UPI0035D57D38
MSQATEHERGTSVLQRMARRFTRRSAAAAGAVLLATTGLGLATGGTAHASGHGEGWYGVWASDVNLRRGGEGCYLWPSVTECFIVDGTVSAPAQVWVYCQTVGGQVVGGNPYWVWVRTADGRRGYIASYFIDNVTNWIDGVPDRC